MSVASPLQTGEDPVHVPAAEQVREAEPPPRVHPCWQEKVATCPVVPLVRVTEP